LLDVDPRGGDVAFTVVTAYFTVACATAVVAFVASKLLGDARRPATHRVSLSLVAGAIWPMLVLGLVELSSVAVYAKVHEAGPSNDDPAVGF
jgi:hypothetical protein